MNVATKTVKKFDRRNRGYRDRIRAIALIKSLTPHGFQCYICGRCFSNNRYMSVDHVVPQSDNGVEDFDNVMMACKPCNGAKQSHSIKTVIHWIGSGRWDERREVYVYGALKDTQLTCETEAQIKWLPRDFSEAKSLLLTKLGRCDMLRETFLRIDWQELKTPIPILDQLMSEMMTNQDNRESDNEF